MIVTSRNISRVVGALVIALGAARGAEAGPPLICHVFDAGAAPVLPWKSSGDGGLVWKTPDPSYDVQRLAQDTLRLLSADAPILARMENMRRATIYAAQDKRVAAELLAAVLGRTAQAPRDSLAWFDAGYLVESYKQARAITGWDMLTQSVDGYQYVQKAIVLAGSNPEMEFAASLMQGGSASAAHRRRAQAGAAPGSLLAKNLGRISL